MEKGRAHINTELKQGRELANQLKQHFLETTQQSKQTCDALLTDILSSYEKALSILKSNALGFEHHSPVISIINSPHSFTSDSSPASDISDEPSKNVFRKRKALPQWSEQVEVPLGTGAQVPLADGHSWRKYGQKDILGATFPRAYYRCTYRHSQGCLATKQVQKSDDDSSLVQVTYKGSHTCKQGSESGAGLVVSFGKDEKRQKKGSYEPKPEEQTQEHEFENIISFGTSHKTKLGISMGVERLPSFSFPCAIEESYTKDYLDAGENNFMGNTYSSYMTPETSECSYLSLSPYHMNNFGIAQNLQTSESDLTEILSAPNSVTNSPIGDYDFSLDPVDFDHNISLDILEFFK
ncbi:hypothetical protein DCAR_0209775 [Daucus carota subsp. sativus]|uniref:WRKY domain-containing protein n=1 Tax=Daucus carota subsp. sativus TaxID=79200 RepID=A0A166FIF6_DAUCS|nr:PREDICTED: probable WRKY transcription factor 30 [Daucus carota subsp. sativus]WOG90531.1 hypothetical protein DCAR_0209775 [Daucus carota subsp. sativus]